MLDNIEVLTHSCVKFSKNQIIYFDPFKIDKNYNDADIIFITHDHYDHFSKDDILKVLNKNTKIVVPESMKEIIEKSDILFREILYVKPNVAYEINNLKFEAVPSYNINKSFHPKKIIGLDIF